MITPTMFIRELSRTREPRQNLNLSMDKLRSPPQQPQQQLQQQQQQQGLPSRPAAQGRMGSSQSIPSSMTPGSGQGSRNGAAAPGGSRPVPGQPRPVPGQSRSTPGHGTVSPHESQHRQTSSKDSKDGDKKEKKKKKLGLF